MQFHSASVSNSQPDVCGLQSECPSVGRLSRLNSLELAPNDRTLADNVSFHSFGNLFLIHRKEIRVSGYKLDYVFWKKTHTTTTNLMVGIGRLMPTGSHAAFEAEY